MKTTTLHSKTWFMAFGLFLFLLIPYVVVLVQTPEQSEKFTREDGIIENLSALFYLTAAAISFYLYASSNYKMNFTGSKTYRNVFFLLLGLLFFFCFGEEISWGQRIFSISPSEWVRTHNVQSETNLHNLYIFDSIDKNNVRKSIFEQLLSAPGILILFWFSYCFFLPIIDLKSKATSTFLSKIKLPVIPVWVGSIFILNQLVFAFLKFLNLVDVHAIAEVKETNVAFLFTIACIGLYRKYSTGKQV